MTTAFVLSGGGSLGCVQVGMLQSLHDHGVAPDVLIGTSAGALNAAYVAGQGMNALSGLTEHWIRATRSDMFPLNILHQTLGILGRESSLFTDNGLRKLVKRHVNFATLQEAAIPLHVVATNVLSGEEVVMSEGNALTAILASSAIPGLLPPVSRDGLTLVDGGLADNTAISVAVGLGADTVYVLPTGYACALTKPPSSALGVAMQSLGFLIQQRLITDVMTYADQVDLRILPPLCPLSVSALDFSRAGELIDRSHRSSNEWIAGGGPDRPHPEQVLTLHHHDP